LQVKASLNGLSRTPAPTNGYLKLIRQARNAEGGVPYTWLFEAVSSGADCQRQSLQINTREGYNGQDILRKTE
ncbi:hypothetical protein, partial [Ruminococcus flavefaciens]|uniref:hypothetical protein n=1 Tax=Ruminococcus flavefaciens TaxID=1265 RepID=UPI0026F344F5